MWRMAVLVMAAVAVVAVSSRPYHTQIRDDNSGSVVLESLNKLRKAILQNAVKVVNVVEEIQKAVVEESLGGSKDHKGAVAMPSGIDKNTVMAAINSDFNKKAMYRSVVARITAKKNAAADSIPQDLAGAAAGDDGTTTTTLDPVDEYCKEACEAGVAGDECDCPDHPIG